MRLYCVYVCVVVGSVIELIFIHSLFLSYYGRPVSCVIGWEVEVL